MAYSSADAVHVSEYCAAAVAVTVLKLRNDSTLSPDEEFWVVDEVLLALVLVWVSVGEARFLTENFTVDPMLLPPGQYPTRKNPPFS
jgi:hypothetical protein